MSVAKNMNVDGCAYRQRIVTLVSRGNRSKFYKMNALNAFDVIRNKIIVRVLKERQGISSSSRSALHSELYSKRHWAPSSKA